MKSSAIAPVDAPTKKQKWVAALGWFGGPEGAALFAIVLAIPFLIKRLNIWKNDAEAFDQSRAADLFAATVETTSHADAARTFSIIAPIDLTTILTGFGPLPAVAGVENQNGDWDAIGQTRTLRLADGTTAREELTAFEAPHHFAYVVTEFSGPLRFLAREARGDWRFAELSSGETRVLWRYGFRPTSVLAALPLMLVTRLLWRAYMKQALRECVRQADSAQ